MTTLGVLITVILVVYGLFIANQVTETWKMVKLLTGQARTKDDVRNMVTLMMDSAQRLGMSRDEIVNLVREELSRYQTEEQSPRRHPLYGDAD